MILQNTTKNSSTHAIPNRWGNGWGILETNLNTSNQKYLHARIAGEIKLESNTHWNKHFKSANSAKSKSQPTSEARQQRVKNHVCYEQGRFYPNLLE